MTITKKSAVISVAAMLALTLCSCTEAEENQKNTTTVEDVSVSSVSEVYDGIDEISADDYTKFSLPSEIYKQDIDSVYNLTIGCSGITAQGKTVDGLGKELAQKVFPNDYDESLCTVSDYRSESDDDYSFEFSKDSLDLYLTVTGTLLAYTDYENTFSDYDVTEFSAAFMEDFSEADTTLADTADSYLNESFSDVWGDFEVQTQSVSSLTYGGKSYSEVSASFNYKGVPIDFTLSPDQPCSSDEMSYYAINDLYVYYDDSQSLYHLNAADCFYNNIVSSEQVDEIISLKDACTILENNLADNSHYDFCAIRLIYTSVKTQPAELTAADMGTLDDTLAKTQDFTPTWCFYVDNGNATSLGDYYSIDSIRVDAVTGDINVCLF